MYLFSRAGVISVNITATTVEITKLKMLFTFRVFGQNTETKQMFGGSTVAPKN